MPDEWDRSTIPMKVEKVVVPVGPLGVLYSTCLLLMLGSADCGLPLETSTEL